MIVCKYYQQGKCHYGQHCRYQHVNSFGGNPGNSNKPYTESKSIVLGVAEEVLAAERGGQWLLSCFGPLKEQPCIPGMDDVSPEEVRWEMYQAQKNGNVDQTKLQFQQLCQAMTAKREALKNPTHEIAAMLDKLQKTNRDGAFGGKTNFALSTPQMSQTSNTASNSNVFGTKPFGAESSPFVGGFTASTCTTSSIFGRSATSSTSVFGGKPSFGGNAMFGSQPTTNSVFGNAATKTTATVFGGNQTMQSFATATSPSNSVFGGTTFGTTQSSNAFSMTQPTQSTTSVFGTTTTAANGIFGGATSTLFGGATTATNVFGAASTVQPSNPFGAQSAAPVSSTISSTAIFGAPKTTAAFGGAPVFGAAGAFGATATPSVFGAQPTFDASQIPVNSVFGGSTVQSSTFGVNAPTANSFAAIAAPQTHPTFGTTANPPPFGTPGFDPFGSSAGNLSFARTAAFAPGSAQSGNEKSPFAGNDSGNAAGGFGTVATSVSQPFGAPTFGNAPTTPFASTTSTATTSNPFAPRTQQQVNTPFGIAQTTVSSASSFGQSSPFGSITTAAIIDETYYTVDGKLSDDEKNSYIAEKFVLGKIPLKPPTIELR